MAGILVNMGGAISLELLLVVSRSNYNKRLRSQDGGSSRNGGEGVETMRGWHIFFVQLLGCPSVVCGGVYDNVPSAPKSSRVITRAIGGGSLYTHHVQERFVLFAINFNPLRDGWFQGALITQLHLRRIMVLCVSLQ